MLAVKFGHVCFPKPVQQPHPPILMGGDGATTFDRVVEFCDGWMPIFGRPANLGERIAELRLRLKDAGRDADSVPVTVYGTPPDRGVVNRLERAGAQRVVFTLPSVSREEIEPVVDRIARLA